MARWRLGDGRAARCAAIAVAGGVVVAGCGTTDGAGSDRTTTGPVPAPSSTGGAAPAPAQSGAVPPVGRQTLSPTDPLPLITRWPAKAPTAPSDLIEPTSGRGTVVSVHDGCVELRTDDGLDWALLGLPAGGAAAGDRLEARVRSAPNARTACAGAPVRVLTWQVLAP